MSKKPQDDVRGGEGGTEGNIGGEVGSIQQATKRYIANLYNSTKNFVLLFAFVKRFCVYRMQNFY